jgi:Flp pilus assembly protein TadG
MITGFRRTRRSAVAIMFALCLLPLVLLVGLAIDTAFYSQARTQVGLAAEAAATHAVRVASGAYTLDVENEATNHDTQDIAASDGVTQGEDAGVQWFNAQLGPLLRASVPPNTLSVTVNPYTTVDGGNNGAGFSATVSYTINYPPIFSALFGSKNSWTATSQSTAQTTYQYVEVLLLLDTSSSMLIGADPTTITSMSENSVCPQNGTLTYPLGLIPLLHSQDNTSNYEANTQDFSNADPIPFGQSTTAVPNFTLTSGPATNGTTITGVFGTCASGFQPASISSLTASGYQLHGYPSNAALTPCAFACHTAPKSSITNGEFPDLYGIARRNQDSLRLDVVITATEKVIDDLYSAEQAKNQYTVGVYQFNDDVSAMVTGTSGATAPADEATSNLEGSTTSALSIIENSYDYSYAGNNALIPAVSTSTDFNDGNTDFTDSATDLLNGKATGNTALSAVITNNPSDPPGSTSSNPQKNIFIVTDGFEDYGTSTRYMGEMTSYKNEEAAQKTATCQEFKNLGFSVYVLYVYYYPVPINSFYVPYDSSPYSQTDATDFSQLQFGTQSYENTLAGAPSGLSLAEIQGSNPDTATGLGSGEVGPDTEALEACASPGDFYEASSTTDIENAMQAMLRSAISSSITVTQ